VPIEIESHGEVQRLRMHGVQSRAVGMDVSTYVVRGVMIDTGFHRARHGLLEAIRTARVEAAIVTHWHEDHAGNVGLLTAHGLPILMRPDTEATLRARPPVRFYRRAIWGYPTAFTAPLVPFDGAAMTRLYTPGHSSDHQVVWDAETGSLFSGDLWLGVRARILHADEDPYTIIESLRTVLALSPGRMFDAHRGVVGNPIKAINDKIQWLGEILLAAEQKVRAGWSDRAIVRELLGGEVITALASGGDYSRRNLVKAARRHVVALDGP
jgi:glyoxylase-like metal-dependent hydrolase (beta-lactamase superfamily II)